jgi:hypothetical protein
MGRQPHASRVPQHTPTACRVSANWVTAVERVLDDQHVRVGLRAFVLQHWRSNATVSAALWLLFVISACCLSF